MTCGPFGGDNRLLRRACAFRGGTEGPVAGAVGSIVVAVLLLGATRLSAQVGNIDPSQRNAWMENAGWLDFGPLGGGVTVGPGSLSGFAWSENLGWVKLGSDAGGPYANTSATNWGVNRSGATLSGFAWSENFGWINFAPAGGGVMLDESTGKFSGYAWSENVGWISFRNTGAIAYGVTVSPAGSVSLVAVPSLSGAGLLALVVGLGACGAWLLRR